MALGPKIWNEIPENINFETSYSKFKEYIPPWSGPTRGCNCCEYLNKNL